jgi:uncharacterized membrane protein
MMNDRASIGPLFVVIFLIIFGGLLIGIFGTVIAAVWNTDTTINSLMVYVWYFLAVFILICLVMYAIVKGQREK